MSADVRLLALERGDEDRIVVTWRELANGERGLELAVERRTLDGWRLLRRIVLRAEELEPVQRAIARARAVSRTRKRKGQKVT